MLIYYTILHLCCATSLLQGTGSLTFGNSIHQPTYDI